MYFCHWHSLQNWKFHRLGADDCQDIELLVAWLLHININPMLSLSNFLFKDSGLSYTDLSITTRFGWHFKANIGCPFICELSLTLDWSIQRKTIEFYHIEHLAVLDFKTDHDMINTWKSSRFPKKCTVAAFYYTCSCKLQGLTSGCSQRNVPWNFIGIEL